MDATTSHLTAEIRARVAALGYEVWDVRTRGTKKRVVLQIRIDRSDWAPEPGRGITVDECADVSRGLEAWLDESQVLGPRYLLEVSSPGIERPIRWPEHWTRFEGYAVRVRLPERGRVTARIIAVEKDPDVVVLQPEGEEERRVPMADAREATLLVDWSEIDRSLSQRS
jgi:ribosome maturation factor RimP